MITVYRVENERGIGPYWEKEMQDRPQWMHDHNMSDFHPSPRVEWGYQNELDVKIFGFTSLAQLYSWFSEETLPWLRENGFKLTTYSADEYEMLLGKFQCAFKRETAVKLEERAL